MDILVNSGTVAHLLNVARLNGCPAAKAKSKTNKKHKTDTLIMTD